LLAQLFAGKPGVMLRTKARGMANAKAKRELGWTLRYPSWRQGFAAVYAKTASRAAPIRRPLRTWHIGWTPTPTEYETTSRSKVSRP
jgi:hypothetical protein